ncbi:MAG TPA: hypothetical protein VMD74_03610, partial [Candidatus Methylomirabilis sp.]|nr:hypothetical protein [Candidatus Methylomirabilis sp.]
NLFHWQVRARYHKNSTDYYSAWQSYPDTSNPETDTDLIVDTTAPAITSGPTANPIGTNSATINWNTANEQSTTQLQYQKTVTNCSSYSFAGNCSTNNDCSTLDLTFTATHLVNLTNLYSGSAYCYRVRSRDAAGNERIDSNHGFTTASVTQPQKTVSFYITGAANGITALSTSSFSVIAPETSPTIKSALVEITGLASGGSNPITIKVNGVAARSYDISAVNPTLFKFSYQITSPDAETNLNLNDLSPCSNGHSHSAPCNQLSVTPGSGMTVNIYSARILVTYSYGP